MIRDDLEATLRSKLQGATPIDATILFDLGSDGVLYLDGKAMPPTVGDSGPAPDTTIAVSASDLQDMLAGQLNPMEAYTLGRLEVSGDMGPAMKLGSLLGG
jgi:putative sterol carrier protein